MPLPKLTDSSDPLGHQSWNYAPQADRFRESEIRPGLGRGTVIWVNQEVEIAEVGINYFHRFRCSVA